MADFTCASVHVYLCSLYLRDGLAKIALPLRKKKKKKDSVISNSSFFFFSSSICMGKQKNNMFQITHSILAKKKKQVYAIALYSLKTASFWLK